jgi:hypothetical protein
MLATILASLLAGLLPSLAIDRKLYAIADGHKGTHQTDATGGTLNADYAEGALATGRRIVLKFDIGDLTTAQLRAASLFLFGGRSANAPASVDTRVYRFSFNDWNDSSPGNIAYPFDSYCTFLAKKDITTTTEWHEFDIGAGLTSFWRSGPYLSLAVRNFTPDALPRVSGLAFTSRNIPQSPGNRPYLLVQTHSLLGRLIGGDFRIPDWPGEWLVITSGGSSAQPVTNPYEADDQLVELVAGSAVTLEQVVDTPTEPYQIEFDHEFRATEGTLEVGLTDRDGEKTVVATLTAPDTVTEALEHSILPIELPALLDLDHATLSFTYDAPSGSSIWLDNISFTEPPPPPLGPPPPLRIELIDEFTVLLAWPNPSHYYTLQGSVDLVDWWDDAAPNVVGEEKQVVLERIFGFNVFYRLHAEVPSSTE